MESLFPGFSRTHTTRDGTRIELPADLSRFYRLKVNDSTNLTTALSTLRESKQFRSVSVRSSLKASQSSPNDPKYTTQWWLNNSGAYSPYADGSTDVDAPEAWAALPSASSVQVAVIDTGIDLDHDDLGVVIDGPNFYDGSGSSDDQDGHGTAVAGVIGALKNNNLHGAGINDSAILLALRVGNATGFSDLAIAQAVEWRTNANVPILNLSFSREVPTICHPGWPFYCNIPYVAATLKNAHAAGIFVTAAMGNDKSSAKRLPACYDYVTAVGAVFADGKVWDNITVNQVFGCNHDQSEGSNQGDWIDFVAPGGEAIATTARGQHPNDFHSATHPCESVQAFGGTSASAPMVAGVGSLLLSANPSLFADDIYAVLKETAFSLSSGEYDVRSGWGLVSAGNAVQFVNQNQFQFGSEAGPNVVVQSVENNIVTLITGHPDLGDGTYFVNKYELRGYVDFPSTYSSPPLVWGRTLGSRGYDGSLFDFEEDVSSWSEVVDGTVTNSGCELKTYVYYVIADAVGDDVGMWIPCPPGSATMGWGAAGPLSTASIPDSDNRKLLLTVLQNPAHGKATFRVALPQRSRVKIELIDVRGRLISRIMDEHRKAGELEVRWDGRDHTGSKVSPGVYFTRLTANNATETQKFVFIK